MLIAARGSAGRAPCASSLHVYQGVAELAAAYIWPPVLLEPACIHRGAAANASPPHLHAPCCSPALLIVHLALDWRPCARLCTHVDARRHSTQQCSALGANAGTHQASHQALGRRSGRRCVPWRMAVSPMCGKWQVLVACVCHMAGCHMAGRGWGWGGDLHGGNSRKVASCMQVLKSDGHCTNCPMHAGAEIRWALDELPNACHTCDEQGGLGMERLAGVCIMSVQR